MIRVGLIGFGKTGKAVASVILNSNEFSLEWVLRRKIDVKNRAVNDLLDIKSDDAGVIYSIQDNSIDEILDKSPVDCVIDFSSSRSIRDYGEQVASRKINIITAISNYSKAEIDILKGLSQKTAIFWSPNITLGVNFLIVASKLLKKIDPSVDIQIVEEHFLQKEGISGTALRIAESLNLKNSDINSVRAGGIVGRHEVIFGFPYQTVRIIHEAISREAFGNGALFVAEKLAGKPVGLYKFEDLIDSEIQ